MADINVIISSMQGTKEVYESEKFHGPNATNVDPLSTELTADQLSGADPIPFAKTFRKNSLTWLKNGVPMERTIEYTEASDRKSVTQVAALEDDVKMEAKYVKN